MEIQITGVTNGQSPYDIFLCNTGGTSCFFVSGNTNIPPSVIIDSENYFPNEETLLVRLIDTNGCFYDKIQDCAPPPPIVTEKSYELVWGHPGVASFRYQSNSLEEIKTKSFPEFFEFSSSTTPVFLAETKAFIRRT